MYEVYFAFLLDIVTCAYACFLKPVFFLLVYCGTLRKRIKARFYDQISFNDPNGLKKV